MMVPSLCLLYCSKLSPASTQHLFSLQNSNLSCHLRLLQDLKKLQLVNMLGSCCPGSNEIKEAVVCLSLPLNGKGCNYSLLFYPHITSFLLPCLFPSSFCPSAGLQDGWQQILWWPVRSLPEKDVGLQACGDMSFLCLLETPKKYSYSVGVQEIGLAILLVEHQCL